MQRFVRAIGLASIGACLCASVAAQAAPSCWAEREMSAARVRQMQTMLMVATLRCRAAKLDISDDYNAFVNGQTDTLSAANLVIKQHFAQGGGTQADYDHFTTSLANGFGDGTTTAESCADAAALAHEAMAAKEAAALDKVAQARLFPAAMPGGVCGGPAAPTLAEVTTAATVPAAVKPAAAALPPVLALAAPAPLPAAAPGPVVLPADVVAALGVMARYHDQQVPAPAAPAGGATQVAAILK